MEEAYHTDQGFWIGPQLFDDAAVEELRDAVCRTIRGERDFDSMHWGQPPKFDPQSPKLAHVVNGWWVNAKIRELIRSNEIGYLASQLMETQEVRLVHDQVLYKPGIGSERTEVSGWQCWLASGCRPLDHVQLYHLLHGLDCPTGHRPFQWKHVFC